MGNFAENLNLGNRFRPPPPGKPLSSLNALYDLRIFPVTSALRVFFLMIGSLTCLKIA